MKKEIQDWLNGARDLNQGLQLIKRINETDWVRLSNQFRFSPKDVFLYLLNEFKGIDPNVKTSNPIIEPNQKAIPNKYNDDNPIVKEALVKANKLYKEMSNERALLFNLCSLKAQTFENEGKILNERAVLARKIMKLQYLIDEAYEAVTFARQFGRLPQSDAIEVSDEDLYRVISNLQKNISRLKLKPKRTEAQEQSLTDKKEKLKILKERYDRLRHS